MCSFRYIFLSLPFLYFFSCKPHSHQSGNHSENKENEELTIEEKYSDTTSLDFKIGQMVMIGINDRTEVSSSDPLIKELKNGKIGGVLLFEKNIAKNDSKKKLKNLVSDLKKASPFPLFVSIDEEGGKVHRLKSKYGFLDIPSAGYLGKLGIPDSTYFYHRQLARLLDEIGINLNYSPDVDLALNPANPVIAKVERSFSADPDSVSIHALEVIRAHHDEGVKTVLKHFPGHGSSTTDSHLGITDVTNQWKILELIPYNQIIQSGKVDGIMTAHIINCHLDTNCLPGTLSKTVVTDVLRGMLRYDGVVFSDDMQMYAISKNYGLENAVEMAINAGVDVIMFGNNVNLNDRITATEIHSIIKNLVESGKVTKARIDEAFNRIIKMKNKKV